MKSNRTLRKRKRKLNRRMNRRPFGTGRPVFGTGTRKYEISDRVSATSFGGIGLVQELVRKSGLADLINERLRLLRFHHPYHESDHVLNILYNFICGGELWKASGISRETAILDVDSMLTETCGEQKDRMDISYKGKWGFHPLVITEANTSTHVCVVNRPANEASQQDAAFWMEYAIAEVETIFDRVRLRGDSAFNLTYKFDEWDSATDVAVGDGGRPGTQKIKDNRRDRCARGRRLRTGQMAPYRHSHLKP